MPVEIVGLDAVAVGTDNVKVSVGNDELGMLEGMTASTDVDELDGVADVTD